MNSNTNTIIINIPSNDKKKVTHNQQPRSFRNTTDLISLKPPLIDNEYSNFGNRLNFQPRRFITPKNEPVVQTHLQGQNEGINETQNDEQEQEEPILETIKQEEPQPQQQEQVNLNESKDTSMIESKDTSMIERKLFEYIETDYFKRDFGKKKLFTLHKVNNKLVWRIRRGVNEISWISLNGEEGQKVFKDYLKKNYIEKK